MTRRLIFVLSVALSRAAGQAAAADPFYERLMLEGVAAYERGDDLVAVKELRLAVFGFLEEPGPLARGLVYLGLAQVRNRDQEGFRDTFHRLMEVEARFGGYRATPLPSALRAELEKQALLLIPESILMASPSFAGLVERKTLSRLEALPLRKRRPLLEKRIAEEPAQMRWRLLLARTEIEDGHADAALRQVAEVLSAEPGNNEARLLGGAALAQKKRWAEAVTELQASGLAAQSPGGAEALLKCLAELKRWEEAADFAATLQGEVLQSGPVREQMSRIPGPAAGRP